MTGTAPPVLLLLPGVSTDRGSANKMFKQGNRYFMMGGTSNLSRLQEASRRKNSRISLQEPPQADFLLGVRAKRCRRAASPGHCIPSLSPLGALKTHPQVLQQTNLNVPAQPQLHSQSTVTAQLCPCDIAGSPGDHPHGGTRGLPWRRSHIVPTGERCAKMLEGNCWSHSRRQAAKKGKKWVLASLQDNPSPSRSAQHRNAPRLEQWPHQTLWVRAATFWVRAGGMQVAGAVCEPRFSTPGPAGQD